MTQRRSFRNRSAYLLAVALLACWLLQVPKSIHAWLMSRRVHELQRATMETLGPTSTADDIIQQLRKDGFTVWGPGNSNQGGHVIFAMRGLASGNVFWPPATARAEFTLKTLTQFHSAEWIVWPFAESGYSTTRFDAAAPKYAGFIPLAVVVYIVASYVRREIRQNQERCKECGYPIGSSNVCTECGEPLSSRCANSKT